MADTATSAWIDHSSQGFSQAWTVLDRPQQRCPGSLVAGLAHLLGDSSDRQG